MTSSWLGEAAHHAALLGVLYSGKELLRKAGCGWRGQGAPARPAATEPNGPNGASADATAGCRGLPGNRAAAPGGSSADAPTVAAGPEPRKHEGASADAAARLLGVGSAKVQQGHRGGGLSFLGHRQGLIASSSVLAVVGGGGDLDVNGCFLPDTPGFGQRLVSLGGALHVHCTFAFHFEDEAVDAVL